MEQQIGILRIADVVGNRILCQRYIDGAQCFLQLGIGNLTAHGLRYFFYQDFYRIIVADAVPRDDVAQKHLLVYAGNILPFCLVQQRFRQAAVLQILRAGGADLPVRFGAQQCRFVVGYPAGGQVLTEGIGRNMPGKKASAQRGFYLSAQHFGVAARDVDMLFCISHAAGKLLPAVNVLHLIQKEIAFFVAHLALHRQNVVEVRDGELRQALVLKIDIDDLLPVHTGRHQIQHDFIQQRGFARAAQTHQHIVSVFLKFVVARHDLEIADKFVLIIDDRF